MITPLVVALPGNDAFARKLAPFVSAELGLVETREFPDGETYIRLEAEVGQRSVVVVCTLDRPNAKIMPLLFLASLLRDRGATRVGLVAPYLAYMRQDKIFRSGEGVTARYFARLLSQAFDWLVTVDPHLHRFKALEEVYSIPAKVVHAAPALAEWIKANVQSPLIIGPDEESEQWVGEVGARIGAPARVFRKQRYGDRDVRITMPDVAGHEALTPILLDDIVSSGRTMLEAARLIRAAGLPAPLCVAVHALTDDRTTSEIIAQTRGYFSTDAVPHSTNVISLSALIAPEIISLV